MTVPALRKSVPKAMLRGFAWPGTTTSNKYSLTAGTVESGAKAGTPTQTFVWDITTFLADLKRDYVREFLEKVRLRQIPG